MPDMLRLDRLRQLRERAGLTQADMARLCGLRGQLSYQTAGAWERGLYAPAASRRAAILAYLWDGLRLRRNPAELAQVWAILVEEWGWEPLSEAEWRRFSTAPLPGAQPGAQPGALAGPVGATRLAPFQAPTAPAHFVGRGRELAALRRDLLPDAALRTVALTGMGGIGKTALAACLAHELRLHFADGVLWAQAAGADLRAVALSWGHAYGHDFSAITTAEGAVAALRGVLATKEALLVLDDVGAAQLVQPLLPGGGRCTVLMTTRSQETAAALGAAIVPLEDLSVEEGVALLADILGDARVAQDAEAARELSRCLQGLPLALEIAGQLLLLRRQSGLAQMVTRLAVAASRLDLQISDRAVRASFAVSWELLAPPLRRAFACLGVFAGRSFALEAFAAAAALDPPAAGEQLYALCARSLLGELDGARFRQHALLAEFAREQLGEDVAPLLRMTTWFAAYARLHAPQPASLHSEWDNLHASLAVAHTQQWWPLVMELAAGLNDGWFAGGFYDLARQGCACWAEAAAALDTLEAEAQALRRWAQACIEQDDYAAAAPVLQRALAAANRAEVDREVAGVFYLQGRVAAEQGRYADAEVQLARCLALYAELQDAEGWARTLHQLANIAYDGGRLAEAQQLCHEAASLPGAPARCLIAVYRLLADIAIEEQDYAAAAGWCNTALAACEQTGEQSERGPLHYLGAVIARCAKNYVEALAEARQAAALAARMGDTGFHALALYEQGCIHFAQNELDAARPLVQEALALMRSCGAGFSEVYALDLLGDIAMRRGEEAEARRCWEAALAIAEARQHPLAGALAARLAQPGAASEMQP